MKCNENVVADSISFIFVKVKVNLEIIATEELKPLIANSTRIDGYLRFVLAKTKIPVESFSVWGEL